MTLEELRPLCENPEGVADVQRFLRMHGVTKTSVVPTGDWVSAEVSLYLIEKMFNVSFHVFQHLPSREFHTCTLDAYSLPTPIAQHLYYVSHIVGLPDISVKQKIEKTVVQNEEAFAAPPSDLTIDPVVIRTRYNISSNLVCTNQNNSHAVAEFQDQNYEPSDLVTFFQRYVPYSTADTVAKVIGSNTPTDPGIEASLDIEYAMGIAPNCITWFYAMKQFNFYQDLTNWLNELNNEPNIPYVISVSYGSQGNYPSASYISSSDSEYQKIGLRGTSIVYASGDSGAECEDRCKDLYVSYPAESIYVTAVGATKFLTGNSGPEGAVTAFKSGGGFSQSIPVPSYQSQETAGYVATKGIPFPPPGAWNSTNRANPDFGALGDEHFQVINGGRTISVGGTSASAPTFASVITLLNDAALNANKPTLGFLNPTLYTWAQTKPGAFFDVTVGNNYEGCTGACGTGYQPGFTCAVGYDAVTGMGTPNYAVLVNLV
jgi:tripeptidyl-peptidase-1